MKSRDIEGWKIYPDGASLEEAGGGVKEKKSAIGIRTEWVGSFRMGKGLHLKKTWQESSGSGAVASIIGEFPGKEFFFPESPVNLEDQ